MTFCGSSSGSSLFAKEPVYVTSGLTLARINLAKWKKLEPNEIDFSLGFSQKLVSRSCYVFNYLPASGVLLSADILSKHFVGPNLDPN